MSRRTAVPLLLALALLPACGQETVTPAASTGSSLAASQAPTAEAQPTPSAEPEPAASPSAEPSASPSGSAPAAALKGDVRPVTQPASGAPLTVRAVRVARQATFDRVVFELAGKAPGAPGWQVEYDDTPTADGSGDPVPVEGQSTLAVVLTGIAYPFDTGVEEVGTDPTLPRDLGVVRDVVLGATFEGQYQAFVGVSAKRAFTVRRLANPARVVVDVSHR